VAITVVFYACWALFGAAWVAGAVVNRRKGPVVREGSTRDRTIYVAVGAIAIATFIPASVWRHITVADTGLRAAGAVLLLVGTAFTLWSRLALGTMWSSGVVAREEHSLRTSGPYRVTRHPIYTGLCGMLIGSAMARELGEFAVIAVAILVSLVFKARAEERLLLGAFPGDYERYRSHVPMFVPGLRFSRS
jgi:protein-S-isoprenylcysteine O-methyltransferase Ste14